jgi:hypothetical protein
MIAGNYYIKNHDSGVVHNVHRFPHGPAKGAVITTCGLNIGPWEEQYGKAQRAFPENITCKRCRKSLGLDVLEKPGICEEECSTVMDGKDVFYEVRMKDGSHEIVYDVMSAQEAADQVLASFDISPNEIECIHKIGVLKVIFPTTTVSFIE